MSPKFRPRRVVVVAVCVAAVGVASLLSNGAAADRSSSPAAATPTSPLPSALAYQSVSALARKARILVINKAQSPILTELKQRLGSRLQVSVSARGSGLMAKPGSYDLVVVDGDNLTAQALARQPQLAQFVAAGRWVLALDMRPAQVKALSRYTGLAGLPSVSSPRAAQQRRAMFLFARGRVGYSQRTFILDIPQLDPYGSARLDPAQRRRARAQVVTGAARLLANALAARPSLVISQSAPPGDSNLPPEVQHVGWTIVQQNSADTPPGSWTGNRDYISVPAPGEQGSSWTVNHSFDLYLDNARRPQGNFQVLTYNLSGTFTPADGDIFFQMDNTFKDSFGRDIGNLERAWWTGKITAAVGPDLGSQGVMSWEANDPSTPNEETSYTSGNDFDIGFSGKEGPNFSYTINNEQEHTIPDWGVSSELTPNGVVGWTFTARHPCDTRGAIDDTNGCFSENTGGSGNPEKPNELSLHQIQFNASARWRTASVLSGNAAQLAFYVFTPIHLIDTYCKKWVVIACGGYAANRTSAGFDVNTDQSTIPIDLSTVNPIPVKSLTFSPNPANGSAQQKVTGSVTLERPAPMDLTVLISSNSQNAVVGQPVNGGPGSSTNLVIPKGSTTGTFDILTNDNGLTPGGHTTAAISAFYTTDNVQQLQINSKKR
jgi:hypothetical protein